MIKLGNDQSNSNFLDIYREKESFTGGILETLYIVLAQMYQQMTIHME